MVCKVKVKRVIAVKNIELSKTCRDVDELTTILAADPNNDEKISSCETALRNWQELLREIMNTNNLVLHCNDVGNMLGEDRLCLVEFEYIYDGMLYKIDEIVSNDECEVLSLKEYLVKTKNNTSGLFAKILEEQGKDDDRFNKVKDKLENLEGSGVSVNE